MKERNDQHEPDASAGGQTRKATEAAEAAVDAWKAGTMKLADQIGMIPTVRQLDLNQSVEQYFDFVQRTIDVNRELASRWADLVNTLSGATREQAELFSRIVKDQADTLAGIAAQQAEKTEEVARDRARRAEQIEKEQVRQARLAEQNQARKERARARERYEDMTKAQLGDELTHRGLPKTGNVDELIDRLAEADSK